MNTDNPAIKRQLVIRNNSSFDSVNHLKKLCFDFDLCLNAIVSFNTKKNNNNSEM